MLETRNLTKKFGALTAVNSVDLTIEREGIHSIIGPNGAGKSTLFHLLTGYHQPTEGSIRFEGENIEGKSPRAIVDKGISRSFQISDLFDGLTVEENVRIATQSLDENRNSVWKRSDSIDSTRKAETLMEDLDLTEFADTRADALSHGDRRKLEVGLAIAVEPDLMLLDEPTAGMGNEGSTKMVQTIRRIADERDIKLVLIEHDLEMVMEISDRITVLNRGAILKEGDPETIQADEDVQEAYIGTGEGE